MIKIHSSVTFFIEYFTWSMAATSRDQSHGEAWVDVIHTGDLLWWGLRAAPLLIRCVIVVHYQFLNLHKSMDYWYHPVVNLWDLEQPKG